MKTRILLPVLCYLLSAVFSLADSTIRIDKSPDLPSALLQSHNEEYFLMNDEVKRFYKIAVPEGSDPLAFFTLTITPEPGIEILSIETLGAGTTEAAAGRPAISVATATGFILEFGDNTTPNPIQACSKRGEATLQPETVLDYDYILIRETIKITGCTDPGRETLYTAQIPSSGNGDLELKVNCKQRNASLRPVIGKEPMQYPPRIVSEFSNTGGISVCRDMPIDFEIILENVIGTLSADDSQIPYGAGAKRLGVIRIPINKAFFTFSDVQIGGQHVNYTENTFGNPVSATRIDIDCRQFGSDPDGPGGLTDRVTDSNGDHLLSGNVFNLLPEGEYVKIVLKGLKLSEEGRANFKLCDNQPRFTLSGNASATGENLLTLNIWNRDMCNFNVPINEPGVAPPDYAFENNYQTYNRFSGYSWALSDTADIAPGTIDSAQLTYTFISTSRGPNDSPFTIAERPFVNTSVNFIPELMLCPDLQYQAVVTMPAGFRIKDSEATITDPLNPYDVLDLNTFAPVAITAEQVVGSSSEWVIKYTPPSGGPLKDADNTLLKHPAQVQVTFKVEIIDCGLFPEPFGSVDIPLEFRAICDLACPDVYKVFGCASTELFFHCPDPCTSTVGITNTIFNRITAGWSKEEAYDDDQYAHEQNSLDLLAPDAAIHPDFANRVYECDVIEARLKGRATGTDPNGILGCEIAYDPLSPGANLFSIIDGKFMCTPRAGTTGPYFELELVEVAGDPLFHFRPADSGHLKPTLRVYADVSVIPPGQAGTPVTAQELLHSGGMGYDVEFVGHFKVEDTASLAADFYVIDQIRCQFIVVDAVYNYAEIAKSCDPWGDNLIFLKTTPFIEFNRFVPPEYASADNAMGQTDQCLLRYILITGVSGGFPLADDFPGEYRPLLDYPNRILFNVPAGYEYESVQYADSASALVTWLPFQLASVGVTPGISVEINDIHDPLKHPGFRSIDKAGRTRQAILLTLRRMCPLGSDDAITVAELDIKTRANSLDPTCHGSLIPASPITYDPGTGTTAEQYNITLTTPQFVVLGNLNPITFPVTLQHTGNRNGVSLDNVWVYFTIDPALGSIVDSDFGTPVNGLYHLGTLLDSTPITGNVTVNFNCVHETDAQSPFLPVEIEVHYGNNCFGYPSLANNPVGNPNLDLSPAPCTNWSEVITIRPQLSDISLEVVRLADGNCAAVGFEVKAFSTAAEVRNARLIPALTPAGFTLSPLSTVDSTLINSIPGAILGSGAFDISAIQSFLYGPAYHFVGGGPNNPIVFRLFYEPTCATPTDTYSFGFSMDATSACGETIFANPQPAPVLVNHTAQPKPSGSPSVSVTPVEGCTNLLHFSIDLTGIIHQGVLSAHVQASYNAGFGLVSSSHPTTSLGIPDWVINPVTGTTLTITADLSIPPNFCGDFPLTVTIELSDATTCCTSTETYTVNVSQHICVSPIACSEDKTVPCGSSWSFDPPTQTPGCCIGSNFVVNVLSTVTNDSGCSQTFTRTWSAEDSCSNSVVCTQVVTVVDTTPPVFTTHCVTNHYAVGSTNDDFAGPETASPSVGLSARMTAANAITKGFDDCGLHRFFAHTFANLPQDITAATLTVRLKPCGDACDTDTFGFYFTDQNGNPLPGGWSRLIGSGSGSPNDLLPNDWCSYVGGQVFTFNLAALPQAGGSLLPLLNQHGFLDIICQDDTAVDYLILDIVSCSCSIDKRVECGSVWNFDVPTASDTCCTNAVIISDLGSVTSGTSCSQIITKTWQAMDCCSNTATCSQTVTVLDTTPPIMTPCPADIIANCTSDAGAVINYACPTASDLCSGSVTVTCTPASGGIFPIGKTVVTCTASDTCGNTTTCSFNVTVISHGSRWTWARQGGGHFGDSGKAVAVDAQGNVFVTGSFSNIMTFPNGNPDLISLTAASADSDIFVAKYNPVGTLLWAVRAGGVDSDSGDGVAVDNNGNVYVTGGFSSTARFYSFGSSTIVATLTSAGGYNIRDIFVAKYDPNGVCLWAVRDGGAGNDYGSAIAWTPVGDKVFVTGGWGAGSGPASSPNEQVFLLPVSGVSGTSPVLGAPVLSSPVFNFDTTQSAKGRAVAVDRLGNPYITGIYYGLTLINNSPLPPAPGRIFVVKFNNALTTCVATHGGYATPGTAANGAQDGFGIAVSEEPLNSDNFFCYVTGNFIGDAANNGVANFGDNGSGTGIFVTNTKITQSGYPQLGDYLIVKLRSLNLTPVWAVKGGDDATFADLASEDETRGIALDRDDNLYVTGFRHPSAPHPYVNEGPTVLVASHGGATGVRRWTRNADDVPAGYPEDVGLGIAVDGAGCVHVTGDFNEVLDFGPAGQLIQTSGSFPSGARDMFLAKMCPACCPPNPVLNHVQIGRNIVLSWEGDCCHLESTPGFEDGILVWSYVGNVSSITLPMTGQKKFFRLVCP